MKKKDLFLNVLLVILIISAAVLTIRVWAFDTGMLSPEAALPRFITRMENGIKYGVFSDVPESARESVIIESSLIYPLDMAIHDDSGQGLMPPFDFGTRENLNAAASNLIGAVLSSDEASVESAPEGDIKAAIAKDSLCFSYGYTLDFMLYEKYLGLISDRFSQYGGFDCLAISPADDRIFVYFFLKDTGEGISVSAPADGRVSAMYAALFSDTSSFLPCDFGWELSDGLSFGLPEYVLLPRDAVSAPRLTSYPYISPVEEGQEKIRKAEKLLKPFGFNRSSGRWYEDEDSLSYISDYATLSLTYDGFFEYRALNSERGFTPADTSDFTVLDRGRIIGTAATLVSSVYSSALPDNAISASYAGMERNAQTNTVRVYFDYLCGGVALCKDGAIKGYGAVIDINDRGEIVYAKLVSDVIREDTARVRALSRDMLFCAIELGGSGDVSAVRFLYTQSEDRTQYIAGYSIETEGIV
ncbi:MAG: hypothetical protein IKD89_08185 [Clostridia bacterium]|nr:hypothetical protein [Clostridia bacterium]